MMEKRQQIVSAILFLLCIAVLAIGTILAPKKTVSETENRTLATAPQLSLSQLRSGEFMQDTESYAADHFLGRGFWVEMKNTAERAAGRQELGGVYLTADRLIQKTDPAGLDMNLVNQSLTAIADFADATETPVAVLLAPTAAAVYEDTLPANAPNLDQQALIATAADALRGKVTFINAYNALHAEREDYIYYRTDHHWTSYGAYCAYRMAIRKLGFSHIAYDRFSIRHVSESFRGTLYSKCLYDGMQPDVLDLYTCEGGAGVTEVIAYDGVKEESHDSIYFQEYLDTKDQYQVYLGGNTAKITVKTEVGNGRRLLLIKDSYANSFLPFLTQHYSEIVLLDLRYIRGDYHELANPDDFSQVLILYNAVTFSEDKNLRLIGETE